MPNRLQQFLILLPLLAFSSIETVHATSSDTLDIRARDGQDIHLRHFAAKGDTLALWVGASFGFNERHQQISEELAARGVEVWLVDILESLFMQRGAESMRQLSGVYVADLIESAHRQTGKNVILIGRGYDAIAVLRGARTWQSRTQSKPYLLGGVLFSPELYSGVPALGIEPQYVDVTYETNIPLMIYQGAKRGNRWHLPKLMTNLQQGGARVYFQIQKDVNEVFYDRDEHPATLARLIVLPDELPGIFKLLASTPTPLQPAAPSGHSQTASTRLDYELRPYVADLKPRLIDLLNIDGKRIKRDHYLGQVTVINFWATWCPPCVREIPSLNRLREKMRGHKFELISVNYAETPEHVRQFMQEIKVDFPVLMDVTGEVSAQWNVIAFPSTFVIGPDGRIRYGVNAAIHWDDEVIVTAMKKLLSQ